MGLASNEGLGLAGGVNMEQRIKRLEERVQELEAKWAKVAYWFTDRPELDNYVSPSAVAFRAYLDGLESEGESSVPTQEPPASMR